MGARCHRAVHVAGLLTISGLAFPGSAIARDYYYFNKPGVERQTFLNDRIACDELAGGSQYKKPDMTLANAQIWQNRSLTASQAAAASGIASFIVSFMAASEHRRIVRQIERICLADKGYRRFEMPKAAFREIEKDKAESARIDRWFALASVAQPQGKEMYE